MGCKLLHRKQIRQSRAMRVRKKVRGTGVRPRLSVSKSLRHIGVQLIDDERAVTLASFSTLSKEARQYRKSKKGAQFVGQKIAELAKEKNIDAVVFDRGRFKYHGLIAELANAARENGLKF